jgi:hypothetical protein
MKPDILALLNARTGHVKFKHALVIDAFVIGFDLYAYFTFAINRYSLIQPSSCFSSSASTSRRRGGF